MGLFKTVDKLNENTRIINDSFTSVFDRIRGHDNEIDDLKKRLNAVVESNAEFKREVAAMKRELTFTKQLFRQSVTREEV